MIKKTLIETQMVFLRKIFLFFDEVGSSLYVSKCWVIAFIYVVTVGSINTFRNAGKLKRLAKPNLAVIKCFTVIAHIWIITFPGEHQRFTFLDVFGEVIA